jgi:hypothetical protein
MRNFSGVALGDTGHTKGQVESSSSLLTLATLIPLRHRHLPSRPNSLPVANVDYNTHGIRRRKRRRPVRTWLKGNASSGARLCSFAHLADCRFSRVKETITPRIQLERPESRELWR